MKRKIRKFRYGIFTLNTRRFGKVAELMIAEKYGMGNSDSISYDLKSTDGNIEVKFSRALKKEEKITPQNVISSIFKAHKSKKRMFKYSEIDKFEFDSNIQQIKTRHFKYLYYGCFFADKIMICRIEDNFNPLNRRGSLDLNAKRRKQIYGTERTSSKSIYINPKQKKSNLEMNKDNSYINLAKRNLKRQIIISDKKETIDENKKNINDRNNKEKLDKCHMESVNEEDYTNINSKGEENIYKKKTIKKYNTNKIFYEMSKEK